jgi:hypothetical protein
VEFSTTKHDLNLHRDISMINTCSKLNRGDELPQQTTEVIGSSFQKARQTKYGFRGSLSKYKKKTR